MPDLVLSSTSVSTWLDCPLQWWFRYIVQADGEQSEELRIGIATHEHVQELLSPGTGGGFSADPEIIGLVKVWHEQVLPDIGVAQYVEEPYRFSVNGIPYQSILDVVDEKGVVRDLKTTKNRPRRGRYFISLLGHALGFRALTGEKEAGRQLDYIVRTKEPYHWPEAFEGPATIDEVAEFGATIEAVAEGIDRGEYPAAGLDGPAYVCGTCPYREECGPRARWEADR